MNWIGGAVSLVVIFVVMADAFETILLPRRVARNLRLTRVYYRALWSLWRTAADRIRRPKRRAFLLSVFAPISLPMLFAAWALGLIAGFAGLHAAFGTPLSNFSDDNPRLQYLYFSGVTFLTLGYGDLSPSEPLGRILAVLEAGIGFAFLAIVIGYLPVVYQAFARREVPIALLDARAGSPPTAAECLVRLDFEGRNGVLDDYLRGWEVWTAEILESHLSFPVLALFRSQHDDQSWLASLTMILDSASIVLATGAGPNRHQARLTYAMARHAAVDLAQTFHRRPAPMAEDRLDSLRFARLVERLGRAGYSIPDPTEFRERLDGLRESYEPFVATLAEYCLLELPPILAETPTVDNWRTSAWMRRSAGLGKLAESEPDADPDDHDD